jgi:hypothetical protein
MVLSLTGGHAPLLVMPVALGLTLVICQIFFAAVEQLAIKLFRRRAMAAPVRAGTTPG